MSITINGTSGISGVDGSAGTPALQGSDTNTGISFGADTVNINTGGTTRATVDSSGRLLVGPTTGRSSFFNGFAPTRLQVENAETPNGGDNTAEISVIRNTSNSNGGCIILGKTRSTNYGQHTIAQAGDELGLLDFQGADGTDFVIGARIQAFVDGTPGANDMPGRLVFSTTADGASSPTERFRIDSEGRGIWGSTLTNPTNGHVFNPNGGNGFYTQTAHPNGTSSGVAYSRFMYNQGEIGSITQNGTTAVSYNTSSDYRLKENVTAVTDGITRLQQLKPSRFNFIADPDKTVDGFIAHEVQAVVPEAITGEKDAVDDEGNPQYQGIDQSKLVPLLTAALQEAIGRIEALEAEVESLKAQ